MKSKKYKRKASKLKPKLDRCSKHRKRMEGKSNIAAKRITLLPGFLANGFTSSTIRKHKSEKITKNSKSVLSDRLHPFLDQNRKDLRRSQRILKKSNEVDIVANNLQDNCDDNAFSFSGLTQNVDSKQDNVSFKSILKNNSKSIFKEINKRFSVVAIQNKAGPSQKLCSLDDNSNSSNKLKGNIDYYNFSTAEQDTTANFNLKINRLFCEDLKKQLCITVRKTEISTYQRNVKIGINYTNLVLEGKEDFKEMLKTNLEEPQSCTHHNNESADNFIPVPYQNWVYRTPPNQKVNMPEIEHCQLETGVMCGNRNRQTLYEFKENSNVDFMKFNQNKNVPIDPRFLTKVAHVQKTPSKFDFQQDTCMASTSQNMHGGWRTNNTRHETLFNEPTVPKVIGRPKKLLKNITFPDLGKIPSAQVNMMEKMDERVDCMSNFEEEFTFIGEGSDFKLEPTQAAKRRLSEDFAIRKRTSLSRNCDNMFAFNSQQTNIFDFSKDAGQTQ